MSGKNDRLAITPLMEESTPMVYNTHPPQAVPLSRCGSVTLEGKQHSVVFLHSRAASLPQGKA